MGPKEKSKKPTNVCQTINVGMSCCCNFSYVPGLKMFFCRRAFTRYRSRGFSHLYHASPGPKGLEPQRGPPAHLLICVYESAVFTFWRAVQPFSFLLCRDRSVIALFSPQKHSPGETIHSARKKDSKLTSYKSVKAMLFVHISLERKEWISCNDVSCIM